VGSPGQIRLDKKNLVRDSFQLDLWHFVIGLTVANWLLTVSNIGQ